MPNLALSIEEELSDNRSNEIAFKITAENRGGEMVELRSLIPRVPNGVVIDRTINTEKEQAKEQHQQLCRELEKLLLVHVWESNNKEYRREILQAYRESLEDVIKNLPNLLLKFYGSLGKNLFLQRLENLLTRSKTFQFAINGTADAQLAWETWFAPKAENNNGPTYEFFQAKQLQLKEIEERFGSDLSASPLSQIEPGNVYTRNYVITFRRGLINQKKFNFSVEARYLPKGQDDECHDSATKAVTISPRPAVLSFIAVLCSLLGTALRFSLNVKVPQPAGSFFASLWQALVNNSGLSAVIVALVFFNIYEHTSLGKKFTLGVDWRAALFIGVMSGLLSERIVEALKTLLGL